MNGNEEQYRGHFYRLVGGKAYGMLMTRLAPDRPAHSFSIIVMYRFILHPYNMTWSDGGAILCHTHADASVRGIATSRQQSPFQNLYTPPIVEAIATQSFTTINSSQLIAFISMPLHCATVVLPLSSQGVARADPVLHMVCSDDLIPDGCRVRGFLPFCSSGSVGGNFACDCGLVGLCSSPALRPCLHPRQSV